MPATRARLYALLAWAVLIAGSIACAPQYKPLGADPSSAESGTVPELNDDVIRDRLADARAYDILPETGSGSPISWRFDRDEPKEITVVDKHVDGTHATVVVDIKTRSSPRANILRYLAGQIRTEWELQTGLALRRWEIVRVENISMKYKDMTKPTPALTPQSSDR